MPLQNYNLASKTLDTKIHSFARPALFTLQQKMRLYPNFTKSGILRRRGVKYSTTSGASKDLSNISPGKNLPIEPPLRNLGIRTVSDETKS
jgi:hypothetical protein